MQSFYFSSTQTKRKRNTTISAFRSHAAMLNIPPKYPANYRVNIITCALCGRRRSNRYRSSLEPESLVCSKCTVAGRSPNIVIELLVRNGGIQHMERNTPHVIKVSPAQTPTKPIELPADQQSRPYSRWRNHCRLASIEEEPPVVDRSTKPRLYRNP